jgi:pre-mRNA-splicing factor CDC5/CEF1
LNLPIPQVTEADVDELSKLGSTQTPLDDSEMLTEYSMTPRTPLRTPRMHVVDSIKQQARDALHAKSLSTPLLGEEQAELLMQPSTTILPVSQTPKSVHRTVAESPRSSVMGTPMRDRMGINTPRSVGSFAGQETPRDIRQKSQLSRSQLRQALLSLPKPKNDFQIVLPENEQNDVKPKDTREIVSDQSDLDLERDQVLQQERKRIEHQRSQTVSRGLPRPLVVPTVGDLLIGSQYSPGSSGYQAERLISKEMVELLKHDAFSYPVAGASAVEDCKYDVPSITRLQAASKLIEEETENLAAIPLFDLPEDLVFDPSTGICHELRELNFGNKEKNEKVGAETLAIYKSMLENISYGAECALRAEKKQSIALGGYMHRCKSLMDSVTKSVQKAHSLLIDYDSFVFLKERETIACEIRRNAVQETLSCAKAEEKELQSLYSSLSQKFRRNK